MRPATTFMSNVEIRTALSALAFSIVWGLLPVLGDALADSSVDGRPAILGPWAWIPIATTLSLIAFLRTMKIGAIVGTACIVLSNLVIVEPFYFAGASMTALEDLPPFLQTYPLLSAIMGVAVWIALSTRYRQTNVPDPSDGLEKSWRSNAVEIVAVISSVLAVPMLLGLIWLSYYLLTYKSGMIAFERHVRAFAYGELRVGMSRNELYAVPEDSTRVNHFTFTVASLDGSELNPEPRASDPHPAVAFEFGDNLEPILIYFDENDRVKRWHLGAPSGPIPCDGQKWWSC